MRRKWPAMFVCGLAFLSGALANCGVAANARQGDRALGEYLSHECVACHQISGRPVGGIPAIVGVPEDQFVALMHAYRNKQRDNAVMQSIAGRLSDSAIASLAAYFSSIQPKK